MCRRGPVQTGSTQFQGVRFHVPPSVSWISVDDYHYTPDPDYVVRATLRRPRDRLPADCMVDCSFILYSVLLRARKSAGAFTGGYGVLLFSHRCACVSAPTSCVMGASTVGSAEAALQAHLPTPASQPVCRAGPWGLLFQEEQHVSSPVPCPLALVICGSQGIPP